ncbi:integrating conjugative element protein [Pseudomonas bijieensis]
MRLSFAWVLAILALNCNASFAENPTLQYAETRYSEDDMLPVRTTALSPGSVQRRTLSASGLPAFFLIGDDDHSRTWLKQRLPQLTKLKAVGLVVNVESKSALVNLRQMAPGLTLSPVSADDLANRLGLRHYPVLITARSIEQ